VVDFNGFGETPEPERPYTVGDYAGEVLAVLDKEGIDSAIFVGHSFGGRVAIELGAKFPDAVRGLVLVDSAGIRPKRKPSYYIKIITHKLLRKLGFKGLKGSRDYRVLSLIMKETFKNVVSYDQSKLLKSITAPTAIFWGKDDVDTPLYMAKKLSKIPDSNLFFLEGGHYAYVTDNDRFLRILTAFIDEV
jgi:pimeloyl-ACP methyl ester carboxylesterase